MNEMQKEEQVLTKSEQQDLEDFIAITNNLVGEWFVVKPNSIDITLWQSEDIVAWPLAMVSQLKAKNTIVHNNTTGCEM